ncbi:NADH dehydrogenase [ubiquinone] 1 alpha subcomplex subunit 2-like [Anneissia japonica]|uniref:NADH dehydrogenase [ubiquinone] 1 alpha subcomplex subunit 2-like n=1 Tax=Anneissia japonica TaxID=1529436 RepID=UPI00142592C5|nr:NADH dehydrogenase [ubiquinone] 1 alpha subcomplex subunit 2-like [Anneissia japonica]
MKVADPGTPKMFINRVVPLTLLLCVLLFCHYKMASSAVRKLPQYLKEIRIHLCQRSPSSQGVRDWVEKYYVDLKNQNPSFPIRVRECSGIQPKMYARYDFGKETCADLGNMNGQQVNETLYKFADSKP